MRQGRTKWGVHHKSGLDGNNSLAKGQGRAVSGGSVMCDAFGTV